jgi:hypothetical protein
MDPKLFSSWVHSQVSGVVETKVWTAADNRQAAGGASRKKMIG